MKKWIRKLYHARGAWLYPLFGMKPWRIGYAPYKFAAIRRAIAEGVLRDGALPPRHGYRLDERIVDRIIFFYAPKILGGDGRPMIESLGLRRMKDAIFVTDLRVKKSGADWMLTADLSGRGQQRTGKLRI